MGGRWSTIFVRVESVGQSVLGGGESDDIVVGVDVGDYIKSELVRYVVGVVCEMFV